MNHFSIGSSGLFFMKSVKKEDLFIICGERVMIGWISLLLAM
jgi:hypothetical protein